MKRKLLCILFVFVFICVTLLTGSAHFENGCYGTIDLYEGEITLDGYMDEVYQTYGKKFHPDVYRRIRGDRKPESEYNADFYYLFTDDYKKLNVFVDVHDTTVNIPGEAQHDSFVRYVHVDCIEIKIDPSNACEPTIEGDGDSINEEAYHYRIDASGFVTGSFWGNGCMGAEACLPWVETAMQYTADGYDFELVINTEPFLETTDTELTKGEDWGIQMLCANVYDPLHYEYAKEGGEHFCDLNVYSMNYLYCDISLTPGEFSFMPSDLDYILLGKRVGGTEEDTEEVIDPNTNEVVTEKDMANNTSTNTDTTVTNNTEGQGSTVNKVGDTLPFAAMTLFLSFGMAITAFTKRRK